MGRPYFDLVLPTTKHERVLDLTTLSYKKTCHVQAVAGRFCENWI